MEKVPPRLDPLERSDLEAALDAAGVGIWAWEIGSERVAWSPQLERLFGFEPRTFDGRLATYQAVLAPADRDRVLAAISAAVEGGAEYVVEHRIVRRSDGEVRWVECRGRTEAAVGGRPARMLGTVVDVTARRHTEDRLAESDEVARLLDDLASDYVYAADLLAPTLAPTIVAGSFRRVTSYTPEEVAERGGWLEVVHPEDRALMLAKFEEGLPTKPFVSEYRILTKSGEVRWLRDHARPKVDDAGRVVRIVGGVLDITERRRFEEQLHHGQKMEALARLAGGVAHDFNNLLTVIFGGVGLLRRGRGPERDAEAIESISTAADRAAELTRALLALGRRQLSSPRPVVLADVVASARSLLDKTVGDRRRLEVAGQISATVRVDPGQLQLVLLNLVANARDATDEGGLVRLRLREVVLDAAAPGRPPELSPGRYGVVDVVDEGSGIAPEDLPHIFEPFFTTKPVGVGTGLGLAVSHGIISQSGGAIAVESAAGRGSTFSVYLPIVPAVAESQSEPPRSWLQLGGRETILLVEDEPRVRALSSRVLRDLGYEVHEVGSAEEALALPAELLARVVLLVSDVRLPGDDGVSLWRALRARASGLSVLFVSGYAPDDLAGGDAAVAALPLLRKPFTPDGLARRVREVLDARGDLADAGSA